MKQVLKFSTSLGLSGKLLYRNNLKIRNKYIFSGTSPSITYSNTNTGSQDVLVTPAPTKIQTEPVDFSSNQPPPNFTSGPPRAPFEPPPPAPPGPLLSGMSSVSGGSVFSSVRCPSPVSDDTLSRYRSSSGSGYASLPLSAVSPYDPSCYPSSAYPAAAAYQQSSYSCLAPVYPPSCFSSVPYQDPLSLAYSSASLATASSAMSAIPSPDSCLKPELG